MPHPSLWRASLLSLSLFAASTAGLAKTPELGKAAQAISAGRALQTVEHLASPAFEGRLSGTEGYHKAATWMANEARKLGLKAPASCPEFLQPFDLTLGGIDSASLALLPEDGKGDQAEAMAFYKDFMPMLNSGSGEVEAEVVFAGFGIRAEKQGRDDYAGLEVRGKVVMVLRGEPSKGEWKGHSSTQARTHLAAELGAAGFLLIDSPVLSANDHIDHEMPEAMVGEALADRILASKKMTVAELRRVLAEGGTASFPTGRKVRFAVRAKPQKPAQAANVVALLPGSDPALKGEFVLVGAHLDHIGPWPQVNPGADDNASGSAALLEVAHAAMAAKAAPHRALVFVWFAGEELGLLGAEHFAEHTPKGLGKCVAVFNMDMVGAGTGLWVSGGENFPQILEALKASRDRFAPGFDIRGGRIRGEARADHGPFFDRGVSAVSLFGMGGNHHGYHTAEDTAYWVTPKTIEQAARTVFGAAWALADAGAAP